MFPIVVYLLVFPTFAYREEFNATIVSMINQYLISHSVMIINDEDGIFANIPNKPKLIVDKNTISNDTSFLFLLNHGIYNDYIIMDVGSTCELEGFLGALKNYSFYNNLSHLIVVINDDQCLKGNFELLGANSVFNVIIIQLLPELAIYSFAKKDYCKHFNYMKISYYEVRDLQKAYFRNCDVSVLWSPTELYVNDPYTKRYPGVLVELIRAIAKQDDLNLTYVKASEEVWIESKESGTYYKVWDYFNEGKSDIYVTAINVKYDMQQLFELSVPIWEDRYIWLIPLPDNSLDWKSIFLVLSLYQWFYLVLLIILMGLVMRLFGNEELFFENISNCFLYVYSSFLSASYARPFYSNKVRLLFLFYVLPTFVFCTYFQGRLYAMLSLPAVKVDFKNVDDFMASDWPIITEEYFAITLVLEDPYYYKAFFRFILNKDSMQEMFEIAKRNNYITVINQGILVTNPHEMYKFKVLDFYKFQNIIVFKKYYYLTERLNMQISRVKETGIIAKWFSDIQWGFYIQIGNQTDDAKSNFNPLTLNHVTGAFVILAVGTVLSSLLFVKEYFKK